MKFHKANYYDVRTRQQYDFYGDKGTFELFVNCSGIEFMAMPLDLRSNIQTYSETDSCHQKLYKSLYYNIFEL